MEKCRVLELIGGSLTDGGAETLVKDYVLNIGRDRFETAVFVDWTIAGTANTGTLTESGQKIYTAYPVYSLFWRGINKYFRKTFMVRGLRKAINEFDPDVIHVHLFALGYLLELGDLLKGRKLLYTFHSTPAMLFSDIPEEDAALRTLVGKYGMRLIALHGEMAKELDSRYSVDNTVVVNNGVDIRRFRDVPEDRLSIRKDTGIPGNAFVIGHVGRFSEEKNHSFLLRVFESVYRKNPDAFLLLVGDGELKERIADEMKAMGLESRVKVLSNRTDIPRLLKAMDVFVFPSLYEGLGIALVEAQAAGLRCIVSDKVPDEAFVTDLVCPLSLSEPVDRWRDAVLDENRRGRYRNRLEEYDIRSCVGRLEKLYLGEI